MQALLAPSIKNTNWGFLSILIFGAIFFKFLSNNSENKPLITSFCVCFFEFFENRTPQVVNE
jgi:hypothetical protein